MKKTRFAASVSVVGLLAIGILMFPVPHLVRCSFFSQPARSQNVFVTLPGFLSEIRVGNGEVVRKGDLLAELSNPDLALEIERLQAELDQADVNLRQIGNQKTRLTGDQATIDEVQSQEATANAAFKLAENRLLQKLQELEKLKIVAPVDGVFVSDSWKPKPGAVEAITKPVSWTGFPLDRRNRGAWLETRTRIGQVVQTGMNQEIILAVDQGDIEFIKPDQKVTLWIRQIPGRVFESRTDRIAPAKMLTVPPALSSRTGGDLVTTRDADGNDVPQSTTWQVSVPIDDTEVRIAGGATGLAHIRVGTQPLIHRIYRELCRTFRFEL